MNKITVYPEDNLQKIFDEISSPCEIFLKNGVYRQKLWLDKPDVTLIGESRENVIISYGDYANKIHEDGREYNTFRTYTLCVTGENVRIENLTIENSSAYNDEEKGQKVALSVNSKRFCAQNVDLKSTQDTLYLAPFPDDLVVRYDGFIPRKQLYMEGYGVHAFVNCRIYGTVDFIFGCSEAYFKDCEIISLGLNGRIGGYLAAPAHSLKQEYGFVFVNCALKDGGAKEGVYLARPWRDFGACAFIDCTADSHLDKRLVNKWNDTYRDKTARFCMYGMENYVSAAEPWLKILTKDEARTYIGRCEKVLKDYNL